MIVRRLLLVVCACAAIVLAAHGRASAAISCTVTAPSPYSFGDYDVLGAKVPTTGTISITCTGGGSPIPMVTLSGGSSGDPNNRAMPCTSGSCLSTYPGDVLLYGLYTNTGHTNVWGATAVSFGACGNTTCTKIVYGLIPKAVAGASNDVAVGGYSDSITVTANY